MADDDGSLVATCIATRGRPHGLTRLLESISRMVVPAGVSLVVIVVDNDPAPSVERAAIAAIPHDAELLHEPRPGIPYARNASVQRALEVGADLLAFVDDDERVSPEWLVSHLKTLTATGADATLGPVVSVLPPSAPAWLERSGVLQRPRHGEHERIGHAETNNVVVRTGVFEHVRPWFDPGFALTGGSDTEFFRRVIAAGYTVRWSGGAVVYEDLPEERATARWAIRRAFRGGSHHGFIVRYQDGLLTWSGLNELLTGMFRLCLGVGALPLGVFDRAWGTRALRKAGLGLGQVAGLLGYRVTDYGRA